MKMSYYIPHMVSYRVSFVVCRPIHLCVFPLTKVYFSWPTDSACHHKSKRTYEKWHSLNWLSSVSYCRLSYIMCGFDDLISFYCTMKMASVLRQSKGPCLFGCICVDYLPNIYRKHIGGASFHVPYTTDGFSMLCEICCRPLIEFSRNTHLVEGKRRELTEH